MQLEVEYRDGLIEIRPAELEVKLVQQERWWVAEGIADGLTSETVNQTLDKVRTRDF